MGALYPCKWSGEREMRTHERMNRSARPRDKSPKRKAARDSLSRLRGCRIFAGANENSIAPCNSAPLDLHLLPRNFSGVKSPILRYG